MDMPVNESLRITRKQRKGPVVVTVFLGLLLTILTQTLLSLFDARFPNSGLREIYDNASLFIVILVVLAYCYLIEKRTPASLGFTRKNAEKNYLIGLLLGFGFISVVFLLNLFTGAIEVSFDFASIQWWYILLSFIGFIFQGMMEEVVCRGFIMNGIASKYGVVSGVIINSIIFALLHASNGGFDLLAGINLFLIGLMFSLLFYYSNSIFIVGALHAAWNFTVGPIYGVQISGIPVYSPIISTVGKESHALMNGGAFGFEGGLGVTLPIVALLLMLTYLIKTKRMDGVD